MSTQRAQQYSSSDSYTTDELTAAWQQSTVASMPFKAAMASPLFRVFVRAKAKDLRNRAAAQRPSGYKPGAANVAETFKRVIVHQKRITLNVRTTIEDARS
jgi:hypothetical protein